MAERKTFFHCGRQVSSQDIEYIKEVVGLFGGLSRLELAHTICEHWGWVTASGSNRVQACMKLLDRLQAQGDIRVKSKQEQKHNRMAPPCRSGRSDPGREVSGRLSEKGPVRVEVVAGEEERGLWNEYVDRYHYLGYHKPIGFALRYFIESPHGKLGCVLLAGAAKSIKVRDEWIGWTREQRMRNLPWVVNNSRFLIFPWVQVSHLASHALGQLARRVREDWYQKWGYRPVLMETFVDPARFQGTCYRAAGWTLLGMTAGSGRPRGRRAYSTTPKMIYVRPLVRDFREQLCSEQLVGRTLE